MTRDASAMPAGAALDLASQGAGRALGRPDLQRAQRQGLGRRRGGGISTLRRSYPGWTTTNWSTTCSGRDRATWYAISGWPGRQVVEAGHCTTVDRDSPGGEGGGPGTAAPPGPGADFPGRWPEGSRGPTPGGPASPGGHSEGAQVGRHPVEAGFHAGAGLGGAEHGGDVGLVDAHFGAPVAEVDEVRWWSCRSRARSTPASRAVRSPRRRAHGCSLPSASLTIVASNMPPGRGRS